MEKSCLHVALVEAQQANAWVTLYMSGCSSIVFKPERVEDLDYHVVVTYGKLGPRPIVPEEIEPVSREEAQSGQAMKERLARISPKTRPGVLTIEPDSVHAVFVHHS